MTPIEVMAKAIKEGTERIYIRSMHDNRAIEIARAALLALAEVELSQEVLRKSLQLNNAYATEVFHAICRALAEDKST